jgi:hypothetical protein
MSHAGLKELAYRSQNGLEVRLFWDPARTKCLSMSSTSVDDDGFRLTIAGRSSLDAFNHPTYATIHQQLCSRRFEPRGPPMSIRQLTHSGGVRRAWRPGG